MTSPITEQVALPIFTFPEHACFHHVRPMNAKGDDFLPHSGATIAYFIDHVNNRIVAAIAICGKDELFSKAEGRKISLARLKERIDNDKKTAFTGHDKPLSVIFTTDDIARCSGVEMQGEVSSMMRNYVDKHLKVDNPIAVALDATLEEIPALLPADIFAESEIRAYKVRFLINKVTEFFAKRHKLRYIKLS